MLKVERETAKREEKKNLAGMIMMRARGTSAALGLTTMMVKIDGSEALKQQRIRMLVEGERGRD